MSVPKACVMSPTKRVNSERTQDSDTLPTKEKHLLPTQLPNPKGGRPINPKPKHFQVAKDIIEGKPLGTALKDAGYSEACQRNAGQVIRDTPAILAASKALLEHYDFSPENRKRFIRQRLMKEVLTARSSDAIRACEVAGKDKEIRLFEADTQVNILNAYVPGGISEVFDVEAVTEEAG